MIRRHAFGFRAALMAADGALAAIILVVLSIWRFGQGWTDWWGQLVPEPVAFFALWSVGWVLCLTLNGLYRPRARWSLRSEAVDVLRGTALMVGATLSVLFFFHMPDVSRLVLLASFPALAVTTVASRAVLRRTLEARRRQGRNQRHVLIIGAGPRGQSFATKLEGHHELGLRIEGFLDDSDEYALPATWSKLGSIDDLERILHEHVVDEVAICLPFSQWTRIDAISQLCEEEGKIVRIPIDVLGRAISTGRIEDLDGTPVYSLVSGPDRTLALVVKRAIDLTIAAAGLLVLSPVFGLIAIVIAAGDGRPVFFRQERVGLHGRPFSVLKFRSMERGAEARIDPPIGGGREARVHRFTDHRQRQFGTRRGGALHDRDGVVVRRVVHDDDLGRVRRALHQCRHRGLKHRLRIPRHQDNRDGQAHAGAVRTDVALVMDSKKASRPDSLASRSRCATASRGTRRPPHASTNCSIAGSASDTPAGRFGTSSRNGAPAGKSVSRYPRIAGRPFARYSRVLIGDASSMALRCRPSVPMATSA